MTGGQRSPGDLAAAAYEATRALNHATLPGRCDLTDQHDVCIVLANLSALLHVTPQALRQIAGWLAREHQVGRALRAAGSWVALAADSVDDAHQGAAHLVTGAPSTRQIGT